jgi:hypothetical protein
MPPLREQSLIGEYLEAVTRLLQRVGSAHPTVGGRHHDPRRAWRAFDPMFMPDASRDQVAHVVNRGLAHAADNGIGQVDLEVDRADDVTTISDEDWLGTC